MLLMFDGKPLGNHRTLAFYDVRREATIRMMRHRPWHEWAGKIAPMNEFVSLAGVTGLNSLFFAQAGAGASGDASDDSGPGLWVRVKAPAEGDGCELYVLERIEDSSVPIWAGIDHDDRGSFCSTLVLAPDVSSEDLYGPVEFGEFLLTARKQGEEISAYSLRVEAKSPMVKAARE
jgi:hypothetical protein